MIDFNQLDDTILKYLDTTDTDYAILLNGDWGSGKTYYLTDHLIPLLSKEKNEIKCLYVSLFGVKNTNDLSKKILLEIFPILKSKVSKGIGALGKTALSYFGIHGGDGASDELLDQINKIDRNTLLIFDDLERLDADALIEVVGYINQFVEHDKAKIVIAANTKEIKELDKKNNKLSLYLEKVIRYSIDFAVPFKETSFEIFNKHKISAEFQTHIESAFVKGNNRNLRTLQFICSISGELIESIPESIKESEHGPEIEKLVICFASAIAIEMKTLGLKIEDFKRLASYSMNVPLGSLFDQFTDVSVEDVGKNKKRLVKKGNEIVDHIHKTYFTSTQMMYFESILNYLYKGFLVKDLFVEELQKCQEHLKKIKGTEEGAVWNALMNWILMEEQELKTYVEKAIDFAEHGRYSLEIYYQLFLFVRNLKKRGIFSIKEKELYERLNKGLSKCKATELHIQLFDAPDSDDKQLKKLYDSVISAHYKNSSEVAQKEAEIHIDILFKDPVEYKKKYLDKESVDLPTFNSTISPKDFVAKFDELSNANKYELCGIFHSRTPNNVSFTKSELIWTRDLKSRLQSSLKKQKRSIGRINKERLIKTVESVIKHWSSMEEIL